MADSVGSVYVEVRPDARLWSERLRAELRDVTVTVPVDADTTRAKAKIDELGAKSPDVHVDVDDAAAATKLAALQAQVDKLDGRTAKVNVKADKSSVSSATSVLEKFAGTLGLLPGLAIAGGAALIPLTAAVGGLAAALAAPLVFAGGGAGLFAVMAGFAVKDTEKQLKAISKLQGSLDGLKKGSKEYLAVQKQIKQQTDALSPAQRKLGDAQSALGASFSKLIQGKTGDALLGPLAQGMTVLSQILPKLQPVIVAVSGALTTMLDGISKAASGPGFARFIGDISKQIGPDLLAFGGIIGDVTKGVGNLLNVFGKRMSGGLLDQLERLGSSFADWSSSKEGRRQVRDFIDYVHEVGPQVASTIGKIADAFGQIGAALAPLAPGVLHALGGAADAISAIDPKALTTLAEVVLGLTAFNKLGGFKVLGALNKGASAGGAGGPIAKAIGGGVQKVFVVNMPGGGIPGAPGGGKPVPVPGVPGSPNIPGGPLDPFKKVPVGPSLGVYALIAAGGVKLKQELDRAATTPTPTDPNALAKSRLGAAQGLQPVGGGAPLDIDFDKLATSLDHYGKASKYALELRDKLSSTPYGSSGGGILGMLGLGGGDDMDTAIGALHDLDEAMRRAGSGDLGKHLRSTTDATDGLKQGAANASHQLDQIGPHAELSSGRAIAAFHAAQAALNALHDKRIAIIVDTQGLINKLQAINDFHIADKSFTVNVTTQHFDRMAGPGGGMGRHAAGGWINGPGTGTSDSVPSLLSTGEFVVNAAAAAANRAWLDQINSSGRASSYRPATAGAGGGGPVTVQVVGHIDENGYVSGTAHDVYQQNHDFGMAHGS